MPHIQDKHLSYRFGAAFVVLGLLGYTVAFGFPAWEFAQHKHDTKESGFSGYWQYACQGVSSCKTYPVIVNDGMFQAVRSLACISLVIYCIGVVLIIIHNCTGYARKAQSENSMIPFCQTISGLFALVPTALYCTIILQSSKPKWTYTVSWALVLACVSILLTVLGGLLMLHGLRINRRRGYKEQTRPAPNHMSSQETHTPVLPITSETESIPLALIAVPVTCLSPSGAINSDPIQRVRLALSGASTEQSNASHTKTVPEPSAPRLDPSAPPPPPEYSLYY